MRTLHAIIVDDEILAIEVLQVLIEKHCSNIIIKNTFNNSVEALQYIKDNDDINLLFTDIEMPNLNGLQLASLIGNKIKVIFTTAYDKFAIKAFKYNAIDYLLKPIDTNDLINCITKINTHFFEDTTIQLQQLNYAVKTKQFTKIALTTADGLLFVEKNEIIYFIAKGAYTEVFTTTKNILISKNIAHFEELICEGDSYFFRPHKSYIINLNYVVKYIKGEGGEIILQNNVNIPVSRHKKEALLNRFTS